MKDWKIIAPWVALLILFLMLSGFIGFAVSLETERTRECEKDGPDSYACLTLKENS